MSENTYSCDKKIYLNLGCGSRCHPEWINIDIAKHNANVTVHDLRKGIPLPGDSCDVVYHSDLLEHLRPADALPFLRECRRVLKHDGIIRVAVPDLETICRIYLNKLENILSGNTADEYDYEWIMLEMYDQAVREQTGGDMSAYLRRDPLPNEAFVYKRIGEEGRNIVCAFKQPPLPRPQFTWRSFAKRSVSYVRGLPKAARDRLLVFLLGQDGVRALEIGRFRISGEAHHWMYDRHSLTQAMLKAGFRNPIQQSAESSLVTDWSRFNLDTLPDGTVIKPDSLFIEAVK